jgi:hypothetical protein
LLPLFVPAAVRVMQQWRVLQADAVLIASALMISTWAVTVPLLRGVAAAPGIREQGRCRTCFSSGFICRQAALLKLTITLAHLAAGGLASSVDHAARQSGADRSRRDRGSAQRHRHRLRNLSL